MRPRAPASGGRGARSSPLPPLRATLLGALLACLALAPAPSQVLAAGTRLLLIETPSFAIYFPPELAAEAGSLASFAEEARAEVEARLGLPAGGAEGRVGERRERLPVLLSAAEETLNGHYTPYPSRRIILRAVPPELDGELGSHAESLRGLFSHELAHALSLSLRGPLWEGLGALLGDPLAPALLAAPLSFIEGAAVAAESPLGEGRAADPRNLGYLRQALAEGEAPSFWQASGARDGFPWGSGPYLYGGAFTAWLLEKRGAEAYAALWRGFASLRPIDAGLFWRGAFQRSYGRSLEEAWEAFLRDSRLELPLLASPELLDEAPGSISALTAGRVEGGRRVYWAEASAGAVFALELEPGEAEGGFAKPGPGRPRRLFAADGLVNRLALSPDGRRLLVSSARLEGGFSRLSVREWDLEEGRFRGPELEGLREACYAGPSEGPPRILGIAPRGFQSDLVLEEGGKRSILLSGGEGRNYGSPAWLEGRVFLLARLPKETLLLRLDEGGPRALAADRSLEGLRYLSAGAGRLAFGFALPGGLYRLGLLEGAETETPVLRLQGQELSGGVQLPSPLSLPDGGLLIPYLARLAGGEFPAAYPLDLLALEPALAEWRPLDPSLLAPAPQPPAPLPSRPAPALPLLGQSFRFPTLSEDYDAAGLVLLGEELGSRLAWELGAQYSWGAEALSLGLALEYRPAPWSLRLGLRDDFSRAEAGHFLRESSASLGLGRDIRFFPARRRLSLGLSLEGGALDLVEPGSAYAGGYGEPLLGAWTWLEYADLHAAYLPPFPASGASARLSLDAELGPGGEGPAFGLGLKLLGALPGARLELELHGALGLEGGLLFGPRQRSLLDSGLRRPSLLSPGYPLYREYAELSAAGSLYGFGEARLLLAAAEIQEPFFRTGLYLRRILLRGGLRGAAIAGELSGIAVPLFLSSAFGRLELEAAPLFGSLAAYGLLGGVELALPFREDYAQEGWSLGFLLGLRL